MRAGKSQKVRGQGHKVTQRISTQQQKRNNSAVDGHINLKLGAVFKMNRN